MGAGAGATGMVPGVTVARSSTTTAEQPSIAFRVVTLPALPGEWEGVEEGRAVEHQSLCRILAGGQQAE